MEVKYCSDGATILPCITAGVLLDSLSPIIADGGAVIEAICPYGCLFAGQ
jgi:hypothetical protein